MATELFDECIGPQPAHFVVKDVSDKQVNTLVCQQRDSVLQRREIEASRALDDVFWMGIKGQDSRSSVGGLGGTNHFSQESLVSPVNAVKCAYSQKCRLLLGHFGKFINALK